MFPDLVTIFIALGLAVIIVLIAYVMPGRAGAIFENMMIIILYIYIFYTYKINDALIIFAYVATLHANLSHLFDKEKRQIRQRFLNQVSVQSHEILRRTKDFKRIFHDILLMLLVTSLALIFLIWAPETYVVIKFFISITLMTAFIQLIGRLGNYLTTTIYYMPEAERLMIVSLFESRSFPLEDLKKVTVESQPDILKLHPMFTFLAQLEDYTTSTGPVIRLDFPGEHIYFSPEDPSYWREVFGSYLPESTEEPLKEVVPMWHPKNLNRLLWKGYFAITVKGISAYTGLLLLLIYFKVPAYGIVGAIVGWWLFNLYVSDRVLIAGTDAEPVTEGMLYEIVQRLSERADIKQPHIYLIDSPIYNGLATGMNIGRGTIMVTTATMNLSKEAVEAIIAHEIAHVKNRDILINQIARAGFFLIIGSSIYIFYDQFILLTENFLLFVLIIYLVMMFFPIYTSMVSQFCEMRADYFAGKFLQDRKQVAKGLVALGTAQEKALKRVISYTKVEQAKKDKEVARRGVLQRGPWYIRLLEFQFMAHPPLYFRIQTLQKNFSWWEIVGYWLKARHLESFPDRIIKKID